MKTVVIDTNILIDYANGHASWLDKLIKNTKYKLILPTIVIAEYFTSTALEEEKEIKVADTTFSLLTKQDLTEGIAKVLGGIMRHKNYPRSAGLADLIIAATAIFLKAELATRNNRDFAKIPTLSFFDPQKHS